MLCALPQLLVLLVLMLLLLSLLFGVRCIALSAGGVQESALSHVWHAQEKPLLVVERGSRWGCCKAHCRCEHGLCGRAVLQQPQGHLQRPRLDQPRNNTTTSHH